MLVVLIVQQTRANQIANDLLIVIKKLNCHKMKINMRKEHIFYTCLFNLLHRQNIREVHIF